MKHERFPVKVQQPVARLIAVSVFTFTLLAVVLEQPWIAALLVVDFLLRAVVTPRWSPLAALARAAAARISDSSGGTVSYPPKRFAAEIGLVLSVLILATGLLGLRIVFLSLGGVLVLFSFLEAAFGFCVGCRMFGLMIRFGWIARDKCPECAYVPE